MAWASETRERLNKQSKAEKIVEEMLGRLRVGHFHRNWGFQVKGGKYRFVDFFLRKRRLIIEIDGPEHDAKKDEERTRQILEVFPKYRVIRFSNNLVFSMPWAVEDEILRCTGFAYRIQEFEVGDVRHEF